MFLFKRIDGNVRNNENVWYDVSTELVERFISNSLSNFRHNETSRTTNRSKSLKISTCFYSEFVLNEQFFDSF